MGAVEVKERESNQVNTHYLVFGTSVQLKSNTNGFAVCS